MGSMHTFHAGKTRGRNLAAPAARPMAPAPRVRQQASEIRHILGRSAVQPKLTVSDPNDAYEREADRVAEEVMRMEAPAPATPMHASPPAVQRACSGCGEPQTQTSPEWVQREAKEEEELLQPKRSAGQRGEAMSFPGLVRPMLKSTCHCGGGCSSCRSGAVGPVDDCLERGADLVADRVVREAAPARAPPLAAASADATEASDRGDARQQTGADLPGLRTAHAGGELLSAELRAFYEPRFGRDFSQVRLHHGLAAGAGARALGARAYTLGRDIAFAPGEFHPHSIAGRRLIAHELAHVAQQGRAPPVGGRARAEAGAPGRGLAQVSRRIQRACGPSEIGTVTGCQREIGDIFGTPIPFNVDCDTLTPDGEAMLAEMGEDLRGMAVDVHGFASEEGDPDFNFSLSCLRAYTIAIRLTNEYGVHLNQAYEHGPTPGERSQRRSVCIRPLGPHTPVPVPIPVPVPPEPEPAQGNDGCEWFSCSTPYNMFPSPLNDIFPNAIDCFCEGVKFLDIMEDFLALVPPLAPVFGNPLAQGVISVTDLICGLWDLLEMVFYAGCSPGPCWSPSHIDLIEAGRIAAFVVSLPVDFFSNSIFGGIVTRLVELLTTIIEAVITGGGFASSGPVGAFIALLGSETLKQAIAAAVRLLVEFMVDFTTYLTQNQITHGTPFPLDSCRACAGLATQVGISDYSSYCDTIAALVTPDFLHWESFDPQNPGGQR